MSAVEPLKRHTGDESTSGEDASLATATTVTPTPSVAETGEAMSGALDVTGTAVIISPVQFLRDDETPDTVPDEAAVPDQAAAPEDDAEAEPIAGGAVEDTPADDAVSASLDAVGGNSASDQGEAPEPTESIAPPSLENGDTPPRPASGDDPSDIPPPPLKDVGADTDDQTSADEDELGREATRVRRATLFVVPNADDDGPTEAAIVSDDPAAAVETESEAETPPPAVRPLPRPSAARLRSAANPLLTAAQPILERVRMIREMEEPGDIEALGFELSRALARYEEDARAAGLGPGAIQVGRFALAATLDDAARAMPWAPRCGWLRQGLAAAGPERFFDLMRAMLTKPARHRDALELFYACLSLGFEGRFRERSHGIHELNRIRDQLYRVLRRLGEKSPRSTPASVTVKPPRAPYRPPPPLVSPGAIAVFLAVTLLVFHFGAAWWLHARSMPPLAQMAETLPEGAVATARAPALPPIAGPELARRVTAALEPDIHAGAVEILAGTDGALVLRLSGGSVFPAGSDTVRAFYRAVIDRVGQTLAREPGRVLVVAHTDAWALATERFPTARALTEARAEAVRALLEKRLGGIRLSAEGRGDGEPIDGNDTPAGRAANRRVDIRLYP